MKGLVFTEFLEMVDEVFTPEMTEKIINRSNLPTKGAYTAVGTYDHNELIKLVVQLSTETNIPIPELEKTYGKYLFKKLVGRYSRFINNTSGLFDFLHQIDSHIHVEVRKLYPDAELPEFKCTTVNPDCMKMEYHSTRPFADLAEGLLLGSAEYYNEKINIEREKISPENAKTNVVIFTLNKVK